MIDTLKLMLGSYHVAPGNNLTVQPASTLRSGRILSEYPLWRKPSGAVVKGKSLLQFRAYQSNNSSSQGKWCPGFCKFSVPKIYYGDNYYSTGRKVLKRYLG